MRKPLTFEQMGNHLEDVKAQVQATLTLLERSHASRGTTLEGISIPGLIAMDAHPRNVQIPESLQKRAVKFCVDAKIAQLDHEGQVMRILGFDQEKTSLSKLAEQVEKKYLGEGHIRAAEKRAMTNSKEQIQGLLRRRFRIEKAYELIVERRVREMMVNKPKEIKRGNWY
jgi:hypothetical protein